MKKAGLVLAFLLVCSTGWAQETKDYWVYVRLVDRSGINKSDDAGRSKRGDIVDVREVTATSTPTETEKKEWLIYKASLTEEEKTNMLLAWRDGTKEIDSAVAYRKNKLDLDALGVVIKPGLVEDKISSDKVLIDAKTIEDLSRYEFSRKIYLASRPLKNIWSNVVYAWDFWVRPAQSSVSCSDDSTDGEQVCTINKTGEDYNTLTLWEDAKDGDLVTAQQIRTAECYNDDGTLTETAGFLIDGSTTSSSYYMKITSPSGERHNGTSGGFTIQAATMADYTGVINIGDDYTVIEWMNVTNWSGGSGLFGINIGQALAWADYVTIRYNVVHNDNDTAVRGIGVYNPSTHHYYVYGNVVYNLHGTGISARRGNINYIYNNTVYGCSTYGFEDNNQTDSTSVFKNNIAIGNGTDFYVAYSTKDYNASYDATATGANSLNSGSGTPPTTSDFLSVSAGSENFHLSSGAVEIDKATDLSSPYDYDIDLDFRDTYTPWDMGADEYASALRRVMLIN